jgi:peptidyl-prolyl cis-trans isomerase SurA
MVLHASVLFGLLITCLQAEIIDRIAATLDNQVITQSEITLEIRLAGFLNGDPPDFSPAAKRKAADRLIEQKLIRREMQVGRYAQPSPEEVGPMLQQIQAQRFPGAEQYRQALAKYGISEDDLKAHLLWQLSLLRFIDIRFRPGVQVSDDEIRAYFDRRLPELGKQAPAERVSFDDVHDQIRRILTNEGVDKQLDEWLAETRKRSRLEFHQEAFR